MRDGVNKIIGCGGIGKGLLFHSPLNETLGRSESRLVRQDAAKDYCKLQIVFYYIARLLQGKARVCPIGGVGKDSFGREMTGLMAEQGMDVTYVRQDDRLPTMLSICLQYPDKEGCNFTASNSAGGEVKPEFIRQVMKELEPDGRTIIVAVPEVRLDSRLEMLRLGKAAGSFCAVSIPAGEAKAFEAENGYAYCDLVSVNEEEARAMTGLEAEGKALAEAALRYVQKWKADMLLCVTVGRAGAYCGQGEKLEFVMSYPAETVNTTGAGDAFFGAMLSGLALGLPFFGKENEGQKRCHSAPQLAAVCAGLAVESPDSIPEEITKAYILGKLEEKGYVVAEEIKKIFRD